MDCRSLLARAHVIRDMSQTELKEKLDRQKVLETEARTIQQAQGLLQQVAQDTQTMLSVKLTDIVNLALNICFPDEWEFILAYETLRGKTECHFCLRDRSSGQTFDNIMDTSGGGLVDLVCFTLRIALFTMTTYDPVFVLDEPFRFVSASLQPYMADLLKELSKTLHIQFILTTHIPTLQRTADVLYHVEKKAGISNIRRQDVTEGD